MSIIIGNWNNTLPAAPEGYDNVNFQINRAVSPPNVSACVPRADVAGTKYGTVLYDGSDNPMRYLGADGEWHDEPIPSGGSVGQLLAKASGDDYDLEWVPASGVAGGNWVDRGDPAAVDFSSVDTNGNFHDLDLSAIIPTGATFVHLYVQIQDNAANTYLYFRKKGNSNAIAIHVARCNTASSDYDYYFMIPLNSNRVIEYKTTTSASFTGLKIVVLGWFIPSA